MVLENSGLLRVDARRARPYALNHITNADLCYRICKYITGYKSHVVDLTHGHGRFTRTIKKDWKYFTHILSCDVRREVLTNTNNALCIDYNRLPLQDKSFDIILYDPPYSDSKDNKLYSSKTVAQDVKVMSENSADHVTGYQLKDFARVLKTNGFLLFKDIRVYYSLPYFTHYDLFIQDLGKIPAKGRGSKAVRNYAFWNLFKKK